MSDELITSIGDGVARIIFNSPATRNAISGETIQRMAAFCADVERDDAVRVLLICGMGAHFMAGADVRGFASVLNAPAAEIGSDFRRRSQDAAPLWLTLQRMPQPVVVAVRGFAAGLALSLVAGADFALASETAQFLIAQVSLGLVADAGMTYHLPRVIGLRQAKRLAMLGERIDSAEALAIGLITQRVPDADLETATEALLKRVAAAPVVSIAQTKHLLDHGLTNTLAAQIALETDAVGECGKSADLQEGIRAFIEKRKPRFGRQ